jgi:DnaJ family protein A protein 2
MNQNKRVDEFPFMSMARRSKPKSPPVTQQVRLDLFELYNGKTVNISMTGEFQCKECNGLGTRAKDPPPCVQCKGTGFTIQIHSVSFLNHTTQTVCSTCLGRGIMIKDECSLCKGIGYILQTKDVDFDIPKGTYPDEWLTKNDIGPCIRGFSPGDISILIKQRDHATFVRDGIHLTTTVKIPLTTALAGGGFTLNLIDNRKKGFLTKPGEIRPGCRKCLPGHGMPIKGSNQYGNLYIVFAIEWPNSLSQQTIEALLVEQDPIEGQDTFDRLASLETC